MFCYWRSYTSILSSLLVVCLCTFGGYSVDAAFTVEPVNTVALSGRTVRLNCTTRQGGSPAEIIWRRLVGIGIPGTTGTIVDDCQANPSFPQYSVVRDTDGQCDLVISSSSLELAATYICFDSTPQGSDAELTVVESCPMGSQSTFNAAIGDTITMTCSIIYRGSSVPVLQWSPGSSATDCSSISRGRGAVCSSLSVNIQPGMTTVESQSCTVTFPSAVHVPQCNSWTSTEIRVSYLSRTLTITGAVNNSDVSLNDGSVVIVCHADGYPLPTYRWLDVSSGVATDGSVCAISAAGEYSLECTASNHVTFVNGSTIPHSVSTRFNVNAFGAVPTTAFATTTPVSVTTITSVVTDNSTCTYQDAVIVLGILLVIFFIGWIITVVYVIYLKRKIQATGEGATDNKSQPLSDISNRQPTMTYEPLDVNTQRPVNYQQLPSQTGHQHDYYNVDSSTDNNHTTPYEQLNINTQRPVVYEQLAA